MSEQHNNGGYFTGFYLFLSLVFISSTATVASVATVKLSSGESDVGITVEPGNDLEIVYSVERPPWDRCTFYRYWNINPGVVDYCNFDLDTSSGQAAKHKCSVTSNDDEFGNRQTYTGMETNVCQITLNNVAEVDNATWGISVDGDLVPTDFVLTVAHPISQVTLEVDEVMTEGKESTVKCTVIGGRPAPMINMHLGPQDALLELINETLTQEQDPITMIYTSVQTSFVLPKSEDHGKQISCEGAVLDLEKNVLFGGPLSANHVTLVVHFKPGLSNNDSSTGNEMTTVSGHLGTNVTFSITFPANPAPNDVSWYVSGSESQEMDEEEISKTDDSEIKMSAGYQNEKFIASDVSTSDVTMKHSVQLTILSLSEVDLTNSYRMEATNEVGSRVYPFQLKIADDGGDDNNDDNYDDNDGNDDTDNDVDNVKDGDHGGEPEDEASGDEVSNDNGLAIMYAVVFGTLLMICVVVVGFFCRKFCKKRNVTTPLNT